MHNAAVNICVQVFVWAYVFISLESYLWMKLLGHMVILCLTFWGTAKLFSKAAASFYTDICTNVVWGLRFRPILPTLVIDCLLTLALLVGMKWYLIVVLIYVSLMTSDNEHLFMSSWPCVCLLWRNVYSNPVPLKKLVLGFPGGAVVKNPPANARDKGASPGPGRSHMPQSNEARAPQLLKPAHLEPMLHNKRSHRNEKLMYHNKE